MAKGVGIRFLALTEMPFMRRWVRKPYEAPKRVSHVVTGYPSASLFSLTVKGRTAMLYKFY